MTKKTNEAEISSELNTNITVNSFKDTAIEIFETVDLSFEKQTLPHCMIKYIAIPKAPLWEKAEKEAIKKISKDVSITGFRKGKAPLNIILQKYKAEVVRQTELSLADLCFSSCQKEARVPILQGNNNISFDKEDSQDSKKFIFTFETEPTIAKINLADFSLPKVEEAIVDEKRVNEEIDHIRFFYAKWTPVLDRAAEENDFVHLDVYDLDTASQTAIFNDARFEIKEGKMTPWMRDLVLGLTINQEIEGISKPDETASLEDKNLFKEKKVKIVLKSIERASLPELDDDFAKKLGAATFIEMKEKIEKLTRLNAQRTKNEKQRESIEEQMIEKVIFDIPKTMLETEANHRMSQLFKDEEFKQKWENSMSLEEKEAEKAVIKEKSTQAIRLFYLCRDIIQTNHISVDDEDMKVSVDSILDMIYGDQRKINYQSMSEEKKQNALIQVMMHKAEDYIIDQLENA